MFNLYLLLRFQVIEYLLPQWVQICDINLIVLFWAKELTSLLNLRLAKYVYLTCFFPPNNLEEYIGLYTLSDHIYTIIS